MGATESTAGIRLTESPYGETRSTPSSDRSVNKSSSGRLHQILQQYKPYARYSQYPDTGELRRLLDDVTDDEKMRLLKRHQPLRRAAMRDHSEMISIILSSLSPHQRLDVLSVRHMGIPPLHKAARCGNTDCVEMILSQLKSEQQLTLLSMRDMYGDTPANWASVYGYKETESLLRECEMRAKQLIDGGNPAQKIRKLEQRIEKQDDQIQQQGRLVQQLCCNLSALSARHQKLCDKQKFEKKQTDMVTQRIASDVSRLEQKAAENSRLENQVKEHSCILPDNDAQQIPKLKRKISELREGLNHLEGKLMRLENNQTLQANRQAELERNQTMLGGDLAELEGTLAVVENNQSLLQGDVQRANDQRDDNGDLKLLAHYARR